MDYRREFLRTKLAGYLKRRTMPRGFDGKPEMQKAEVDALLAALSRFAPRSNYEDWWPIFEGKLGEDAKTRAWPTEGEIKSACLAIRPTASVRIAEPGDFDPVQINANRMNRGEAVGDYWIWGRGAVELRHLVTEETLSAYRSGLFFKMKDVWGEEKAKSKEQEFKARHAAALDVVAIERT